MPVLIVEGPERTGKSTLIRIIRETLRNSKKAGVDKNPIFDWNYANRGQHISRPREVHRGEHEMLLRLLPELQDRLVICDRLHFSERVYGGLDQAYVEWVWDWESRLCRQVGMINVAVILCLPPYKSKADHEALYSRLSEHVERDVKFHRYAKQDFSTIIEEFWRCKKRTVCPIFHYPVRADSPPTRDDVDLSRSLGKFLLEQGVL